jgi:hypothetical protein
MTTPLPRAIPATAVRRLAALGAVAVLLSLAPAARAQCVGDCNDNGEVAINELIVAVNIALGERDVADCSSADASGDGTVGINELIRCVGNALNGCDPPAASPTPTATVGPTATPLPPVGPVILFFGLTAANDSIVAPSGEEDGIPVYELPFGRSFHIIVEADTGESRIPPARDTFRAGEMPSFQIQATRALGDGSLQVCDGDDPVPGGVPGVDPPSFAPTQEIQDALNDLGCRFLDGSASQSPSGRGCNPQEACVRFEDGIFGCVSPIATVQYCSQVISMVEEFPEGDTLLSARVLETQVAGRERMPGPIAQIIVRVAPPFPGG